MYVLYYMRISNIEILRDAFGEREFTVRNVILLTGISHPQPVLSRLKVEGKLERVRRGVYRVADPEARQRIDSAEYRLALEWASRIPHAGITLPTCLEIHTRGRYVVGRSRTTWPIHLATRPEHVDLVRNRLAEVPHPWFPRTEGVRRSGIFLLFEEDPDAEFEVVDGLRVLTEEEVRRRLTEGHPDEGALEWMG